jgi:hypothetical protein
VPADNAAVKEIMEEALETLTRQTNTPVDRAHRLQLKPLASTEDLHSYIELFSDKESPLYAGIVFDVEKGAFQQQDGDLSFQVKNTQMHEPKRSPALQTKFYERRRSYCWEVAESRRRLMRTDLDERIGLATHASRRSGRVRVQTPGRAQRARACE